jgi:hypothetical protein
VIFTDSLLVDALEVAKTRHAEAHNDLQRVLKQMVEVGLAQRIKDADDIYPVIIYGTEERMKEILYCVFEGEDVEFWGIDKEGYAEALRQNCDPEEFCEIVVIPRGEHFEWWLEDFAP